jgi:competence protein ComEC
MERVQQRCLDYRQELLDRYRTQTAEEEQFAVLAAMTLGDKSALTKELRETYSVTGASHILALSGLHLGIIYLLLFRLTLGRRRSWLSQVIIILSIWAFAFLTGLSTSVIRSATMISIYALFSVGGRHRSPVNILCFTAIVMLLVNPASLFDIGFQLSFSAVLAILLLMPLFESFFPEHYFEGRPLQHYIYNMVGLSVAAQIGVAPLIAFYFGRFSTYFLLTNFIVIPAATMILYGALLVVMIPSLAPVLLGFVGILNKALGWVSQMPCASIDGLHPSVLQICLLYVVFFCVYFSLRILQRVPPIT